MRESLRNRIQRRLNDIEQFTIDVIYDRRHGLAETLYGGFLRGLSWIFGSIVQARGWLYRNRIFRDQPLGCLVVVVGNLTVGGTGKTPVVEKFARSLQERGRKVAILSRGYRSKPERKYQKFWRWLTHNEPPPPKVVSDGKNVLLGSWEAGDEPFMLACNLPGVVVVVDKNRVKAGEYAIRKFGCDTLILDDGFQYLPLRGQLNLLLVDKSNPFGNQCMLPRGILREPVSHIRRASYVFLTKSDGEPDHELEQLIRQHKPDVDLIECSHQPQYLKEVFGEKTRTLASLQGVKVATFSGIAVPESFETFIRQLGASIVHNQRFLDHHRFTPYELDHFFRQAQEAGAELIVTTEKDAVRLDRDHIPQDVPFYYLRLEVDILKGGEDFDAAVARICFPKSEVKATRSPFLSQKRNVGPTTDAASAKTQSDEVQTRAG
ncbi:tetraacyldisaccharide 4'-kinase [Ruficoccus sp. ZRK36]|uniref:tetraacyldisaccharide 4'-kinase n=1 Tax=Ruficoccus sp. ZRK36 TaxID=2866311 RepID=UPI001C73820C|nr:tetraacyldisaccharide 4'-kinase [Ruficoccus sp. ZRK36]QYY37089.1 tetraacyldisaccharide 4'-kinase [Ruficoccus sp. ZRK36]